MSSESATLRQLPHGAVESGMPQVLVIHAVDAFLGTPRFAASPNTHRAYTDVLHRLADLIGVDRQLDSVAENEIDVAFTALWGSSAPTTWNRNRAAVVSWLNWCTAQMQWAAPGLPTSFERRKESDDQTKAVDPTVVDEICASTDIPLRERVLWRMLYESASSASVVLQLNVEDCDLENRRAHVIAKGGDHSWIVWGAGTAMMLPEYLQGRQLGPLFCSDRRPGPARMGATSSRDIDPETDRIRLGYDGARTLIKEYTGLNLHALRHSGSAQMEGQAPVAEVAPALVASVGPVAEPVNVVHIESAVVAPAVVAPAVVAPAVVAPAVVDEYIVTEDAVLEDVVSEWDSPQFSQLLYPTAIDEGMVPAVETLLQLLPPSVDVVLNVGPNLRLLDQDSEHRLDTARRVLVVRVLEEAIANAVRHGGVDTVTVSLLRSATGVRVLVTDHGTGFDIAGLPRGGTSLSNLMNRANAAGGSLSINSQPGTGTKLALDLPLESSNAARRRPSTQPKQAAAASATPGPATLAVAAGNGPIAPLTRTAPPPPLDPAAVRSRALWLLVAIVPLLIFALVKVVGFDVSTADSRALDPSLEQGELLLTVRPTLVRPEVGKLIQYTPIVDGVKQPQQANFISNIVGENITTTAPAASPGAGRIKESQVDGVVLAHISVAETFLLAVGCGMVIAFFIFLLSFLPAGRRRES